MNKREIGDYYEKQVCQALETKGLVILEKNYRNRYGEIDIIALDQEVVCFIEVKYRSSEGYGNPFEAVDHRKQLRIRQVAKYYYMEHGLSEWVPCRFDVVGILEHSMRWKKNAF